MRQDPSNFSQKNYHSGLLVLCLIMLSEVASPAELVASSIVFDGNSFAYGFTSKIYAPQEKVAETLRAFDRWDELNDKVTRSEVLHDYGNGKLRRLLTLTQCILSFCFDLKFVEIVSEYSESLEMRIVASESSFSQGQSIWRIERLHPTGTRLVLEASLSPDFWIPPLIGPLILKKVFVHQITQTCNRIEEVASFSR